MNADATEHTSWLKKWGSLVILSLALAIIVIDTTLLNVSLGVIIKDLHTTLQSIQWVITSYALMLAAFTITGGRLGDLFGRKRMFMLGAIIFAVGSFLASISHNVGMLIIGEAIIEGIGAALMMPATSSLLVATFKGRDRAIAFGVWGGIAAAASAIGPVLGGYLTTHFSWRWGFRINVFVALLLLIGSVLVKESRDQQERRTLDVGGVVLSASGLFFLVFGFIESSTYGWFKAKAIFTLAGKALSFGSVSIVPISIFLGIFLLAMFFLWEFDTEAHDQTPLVSLGLFKNRQFTAGALTMAILSLGMAGMFFGLAIFFQAVKALDALHTGFALMPLSVSLLVAAPFSAFLSKYITPKHLVQAGLVINSVAFIILRSSLKVGATVWSVSPGLILYGIGMGLVMAQISNITLSAVSPQQAGEASGVNNTLRQVGSTLGSAIIGAVLLSSIASQFSVNIANSSVIPEPLKPVVSQVVAQQGSALQFGGSIVFPASVPESVKEELVAISHKVTTEGNRRSLLYTLFFSCLGLVASFWIPNSKHLDQSQPAVDIAAHAGHQGQSADQPLYDYVHHARQVGLADYDIMLNLLRAGWQHEKVHGVIQPADEKYQL